MKRTLLLCVPVLAAVLLLAACSLNPADEPEPTRTNVWISPDGSTVTIAINGHDLPRHLSTPPERVKSLLKS